MNSRNTYASSSFSSTSSEDSINPAGKMPRYQERLLSLDSNSESPPLIMPRKKKKQSAVCGDNMQNNIANSCALENVTAGRISLESGIHPDLPRKAAPPKPKFPPNASRSLKDNDNNAPNVERIDIIEDVEVHTLDFICDKGGLGIALGVGYHDIARFSPIVKSLKNGKSYPRNKSGCYFQVDEVNTANDCGLRVGDEILVINGRETDNLSLDGVGILLEKAARSGCVTLVIARTRQQFTTEELENPQTRQNSTITYSEPFVIEMYKTTGGKGLGVGLVGGSDAPGGAMGFFVKKIYPDGLAIEDGRLKPGDEILALNDVKLHGLRHSEAIDRFRSLSSGPVRLQVRSRITNGIDMEGKQTIVGEPLNLISNPVPPPRRGKSSPIQTSREKINYDITPQRIEEDEEPDDEYEGDVSNGTTSNMLGRNVEQYIIQSGEEDEIDDEQQTAFLKISDDIDMDDDEEAVMIPDYNISTDANENDKVFNDGIYNSRDIDVGLEDADCDEVNSDDLDFHDEGEIEMFAAREDLMDKNSRDDIPEGTSSALDIPETLPDILNNVVDIGVPEGFEDGFPECSTDVPSTDQHDESISVETISQNSPVVESNMPESNALIFSNSMLSYGGSSNNSMCFDPTEPFIDIFPRERLDGDNSFTFESVQKTSDNFEDVFPSCNNSKQSDSICSPVSSHPFTGDKSRVLFENFVITEDAKFSWKDFKDDVESVQNNATSEGTIHNENITQNEFLPEIDVPGEGDSLHDDNYFSPSELPEPIFDLISNSESSNKQTELIDPLFMNSPLPNDDDDEEVQSNICSIPPPPLPESLPPLPASLPPLPDSLPPLPASLPPLPTLLPSLPASIPFEEANVELSENPVSRVKETTTAEVITSSHEDDDQDVFMNQYRDQAEKPIPHTGNRSNWHSPSPFYKPVVNLTQMDSSNMTSTVPNEVLSQTNVTDPKLSTSLQQVCSETMNKTEAQNGAPVPTTPADFHNYVSLIQGSSYFSKKSKSAGIFSNVSTSLSSVPDVGAESGRNVDPHPGSNLEIQSESSKQSLFSTIPPPEDYSTGDKTCLAEKDFNENDKFEVEDLAGLDTNPDILPFDLPDLTNEMSSNELPDMRQEDGGPFQITVCNSLMGLGIKVECSTDGVTVITDIHKSGPIARNNNIKLSDVLLSVNNIECANRTTEEIQSILNNLPVGLICLVVSANPQNKLPIDPVNDGCNVPEMSPTSAGTENDDVFAAVQHSGSLDEITNDDTLKSATFAKSFRSLSKDEMVSNVLKDYYTMEEEPKEEAPKKPPKPLIAQALLPKSRRSSSHVVVVGSSAYLVDNPPTDQVQPTSVKHASDEKPTEGTNSNIQEKSIATKFSQESSNRIKTENNASLVNTSSHTTSEKVSTSMMKDELTTEFKNESLFESKTKNRFPDVAKPPVKNEKPVRTASSELDKIADKKTSISDPNADTNPDPDVRNWRKSSSKRTNESPSMTTNQIASIEPASDFKKETAVKGSVSTSRDKDFNSNEFLRKLAKPPTVFGFSQADQQIMQAVFGAERHRNKNQTSSLVSDTSETSSCCSENSDIKSISQSDFIEQSNDLINTNEDISETEKDGKVEFEKINIASSKAFFESKKNQIQPTVHHSAEVSKLNASSASAKEIKTVPQNTPSVSVEQKDIPRNSFSGNADEIKSISRNTPVSINEIKNIPQKTSSVSEHNEIKKMPQKTSVSADESKNVLRNAPSVSANEIRNIPRNSLSVSADESKNIPRNAASVSANEIRNIPRNSPSVSADESKNIPRNAASVSANETRNIPRNSPSVSADESKNIPRNALSVSANEIRNIPRNSPSVSADESKNIPRNAPSVSANEIRNIPRNSPSVSADESKNIPRNAASVSANETRNIPRNSPSVSADESKNIPRNAPSVSANEIRNIPRNSPSVSADESKNIPRNSPSVSANEIRNIPRNSPSVSADESKNIPRNAASVSANEIKNIPRNSPSVSADESKNIPRNAPSVSANETRNIPRNSPSVSADESKNIPRNAPSVSANEIKNIPRNSPSVSADESKNILRNAASVSANEIRNIPQNSPSVSADESKNILRNAASVSANEIRNIPRNSPSVSADESKNILRNAPSVSANEIRNIPRNSPSVSADESKNVFRSNQFTDAERVSSSSRTSSSPSPDETHSSVDEERINIRASKSLFQSMTGEKTTNKSLKKSPPVGPQIAHVDTSTTNTTPEKQSGRSISDQSEQPDMSEIADVSETKALFESMKATSEPITNLAKKPSISRNSSSYLPNSPISKNKPLSYTPPVLIPGKTLNSSSENRNFLPKFGSEFGTANPEVQTSKPRAVVQPVHRKVVSEEESKLEAINSELDRKFSITKPMHKSPAPTPLQRRFSSSIPAETAAAINPASRGSGCLAEDPIVDEDQNSVECLVSKYNVRTPNATKSEVPVIKSETPSSKLPSDVRRSSSSVQPGLMKFNVPVKLPGKSLLASQSVDLTKDKKPPVSDQISSSPGTTEQSVDNGKNQEKWKNFMKSYAK